MTFVKIPTVAFFQLDCCSIFINVRYILQFLCSAFYSVFATKKVLFIYILLPSLVTGFLGSFCIPLKFILTH